MAAPRHCCGSVNHIAVSFSTKPLIKKNRELVGDHQIKGRREGGKGEEGGRMLRGEERRGRGGCRITAVLLCVFPTWKKEEVERCS